MVQHVHKQHQPVVANIGSTMAPLVCYFRRTPSWQGRLQDLLYSQACHALDGFLRQAVILRRPRDLGWTSEAAVRLLLRPSLLRFGLFVLVSLFPNETHPINKRPTAMATVNLSIAGLFRSEALPTRFYVAVASFSL